MPAIRVRLRMGRPRPCSLTFLSAPCAGDWPALDSLDGFARSPHAPSANQLRNRRGWFRVVLNTKGSMLQDVENKRRTEIDVINGAIVEAGRTLGIPTPYNNAMVCLIKALEASFV